MTAPRQTYDGAVESSLLGRRLHKFVMAGALSHRLDSQCVAGWKLAALKSLER